MAQILAGEKMAQILAGLGCSENCGDSKNILDGF